MVNEQDLLEYAQSKAILAYMVVENEDGKWNLHFTLNWKEGVNVLSSARKDIRQWTSLNTLVNFIVGLGGPEVPITVHPIYKKE